jgi:DDE superfamily endonuclease
MLDETFILETPPLRAGWAKVGVQAEGPITGTHARRVLHGALNITTGHVECLITEHWTAATHQAFWRQVRQAWRGWHIVLFADRGSPHTAKASRALATALGLEVRWLPTATPELNACEGLWRGAKGSGLANRAGQSIDDAANTACRYILDLTPRKRLQLAGVLSGNFWLST